MKSGLSIVIAAVAAVGFAASANAAGDADKGKKQFSICKACHAVGEGAKIKQGPPLNDVLGRKAGTFEGMGKKYSKLMRDAGENGLVWNDETLMGYLLDPTKFLKGFLEEKDKKDLAKGRGKMIVKIKQEDKRANIIAYLKTFSKK